MKKEISTKPEAITEQWPGELTSFSWQDFVTAIPSPLLQARRWYISGAVCLLGAQTPDGKPAAGNFIFSFQ